MQTVTDKSHKSTPFRTQWPARVAAVLRLVAITGTLLALFLLFAGEALAAGNVAQNLGKLLRGYAEEVYGGLVGVSSLVFLWNRRYLELLSFLVAAIVVAWMVFAPDAIGKAAEGIAHQIFG